MPRGTRAPAARAPTHGPRPSRTGARRLPARPQRHSQAARPDLSPVLSLSAQDRPGFTLPRPFVVCAGVGERRRLPLAYQRFHKGSNRRRREPTVPPDRTMVRDLAFIGPARNGLGAHFQQPCGLSGTQVAVVRRLHSSPAPLLTGPAGGSGVVSRRLSARRAASAASASATAP